MAVEYKRLHEIFIEKVWNDHPSYGHKRLATALGLNRKHILRVMKKFNIKPYRRHRKPSKRTNTSVYDTFPNRFETLGELVYEIYHTMHIYNTKKNQLR